MGNSQLQEYPTESGVKLRNPPSPKLIGVMNQSKTSSPKSPRTPDDNSKPDGISSSPSKSGRSPSSTKSSPGINKSMSLAERLAQSKKSSSPLSKSPTSKSAPTSPNSLTSSKTDLSKEPTDSCLKSNEMEKITVCNGSTEIKVENLQPSIEQELVVVINGISESNEVKQDDSVESVQIKVGENETINISSNELSIIELDISNKPMRIEDNVILELSTKKDIRQKVWEFLEENSLVVFPKPCFNRVPNFKGCIDATLSLENLEEFKKAKTVQVTPDKAQETARFLTLRWGKRLFVPSLRLKNGLLQIVSLPLTEPTVKMQKLASTQRGLRKWGKKLITSGPNNENHHVDMIILGSVAVDRKGHRIGIGNGFCDLEFVILRSMNMVTDKTVVVTIVHDAQVFDTLSTDIFKPYDVPVDIIITPNEIIRVENHIDRPKGIFWNYISKRRLLEMPPLQILRQQQELDESIDCTLKDVDSEPEEIPPSAKTIKKSKKYRRRRSYSTRSDTNDSVFKDTEVSKRQSSKQSTTTKNSESKGYRKRAKSISSQQRCNSSSGRYNGQKDNKDATSRKLKKRTKSESAKISASPGIKSKNSNDSNSDSPQLAEIYKNKRRSRPKPHQLINSDDIDKLSLPQTNTKLGWNNKPISRSSSRVTRRDYIDYQSMNRDISVGPNDFKEYIPNPKKYYSQSRHNSYSQERPSRGSYRSNSRVQQRDLSIKSVGQQNKYSNGPSNRQTRYLNRPSNRQNNFNNGQVSYQNGGNNYHLVRYNSFSNDTLSRQNNFYDGMASYRNNYSKPVIRQENFINSRVFRPPQFRNRMTSQSDERNYVRESRPHFNNNRFGYYNSNSNDRSSYPRSVNGDDFVLKVGNIANNVRVRDLKTALMERGVKPLHITWRGPRGFAYLRYGNSTNVNKDNVIGLLQNVRIKPNGVETAQTQTLIVTECQFS